MDTSGSRVDRSRANAQRPCSTHRCYFGDLEKCSSVRGEPELFPGVHANRAPRHSPGHVAYLITSGDKQFLISADVSVLALRISTNPQWQQAIDQDPQMAVETRKKIFDRAVADKLTISGTHWLMPNVGTLSKDGNGYVFAAEG